MPGTRSVRVFITAVRAGRPSAVRVFFFPRFRTGRKRYHRAFTARTYYTLKTHSGLSPMLFTHVRVIINVTMTNDRRNIVARARRRPRSDNTRTGFWRTRPLARRPEIQNTRVARPFGGPVSFGNPFRERVA